jgi:hypothetical protein
MADELKQLAQMIKNSADTRYAKKGEVSSSGIVVNSKPIVSYMSEAELNAKIANKVAELALLKSEPRVLVETVVKWNMTTPSNRGVIRFKKSNPLSGDSNLYGLAYVEPKNWLLAGNYTDKKLRIYDADTYALIKEQTLPYYIKYIISTYDGKRLLIFNKDDGSNYADIYELNEATNTYKKKYRLPNTYAGHGAINYQGDKIVTAREDGSKLSSYSMDNLGNWELKSESLNSKVWRGVMIHQEFLYAFTSDGKLWRGTYIDGVIGTMEEQVCDIPADKDSNYYMQAYMTMDGSIIYKIDYHNSSISFYAGKVYVFAKQEDDSWKLITDIISSNPAIDQELGVDMCMNADNSKIWVSQYSNGVVDRFDIATTTTDTTTLDANSIDPFSDGSLKHFYKLDGNTQDSVGDDNFNTYGTITYEDAKFNQGAKLTNLGDMYINENVFKNNGTVNLWVKLTEYRDDITLFATHNIDGTSQYVNNLYSMNDGKIQIGGRETTNDAFTRYKTFDETIPLNQLTMLTMTKTDSRIEVYKNGVLLGGVDKVSFDTDFFKTHFGYNSDVEDADGTIFDHIQIFDRILTQDEITKLYKAEVQ